MMSVHTCFAFIALLCVSLVVRASHLAPVSAQQQPVLLAPVSGADWDASDAAGVIRMQLASLPVGSHVNVDIFEESSEVSVSFFVVPTADVTDGGAVVASIASASAVEFHGIRVIEARMGALSVIRARAPLHRLTGQSATVATLDHEVNGTIVYEPFAVGTVRVRIQYVDPVTGQLMIQDIDGVRMFRSLDTNVTACSGRGTRWLSQCTCVPGAFGPVCAHSSAASCGAEFCGSGGDVCEPTVLGVFRCVSSGDTFNGTHVVPGSACLCENGGVCDGPARGLDSRCTCPPGVFGSRCELSAHACSVVYCGGSLRCTTPQVGFFECVSCRAHCSDHGDCASGRCVCDRGWRGDHCGEVDACPDGCGSVVGSYCDVSGCTCADGIFGSTCSQTASQCAAACPPSNNTAITALPTCAPTRNGTHECIPPPPEPCPLSGYGTNCSMTLASCSEEHCENSDTGDVCVHGNRGDGVVCIPESMGTLSACVSGDCSCNFGLSCNLTPAQCRTELCNGRGACRHRRNPEYAGEAMCICDRGLYGSTCLYDDRDTCTQEVCTGGHECDRNRQSSYSPCVACSTHRSFPVYGIIAFFVTIGLIILVCVYSVAVDGCSELRYIRDARRPRREGEQLARPRELRRFAPPDVGPVE